MGTESSGSEKEDTTTNRPVVIALKRTKVSSNSFFSQRGSVKKPRRIPKDDEPHTDEFKAYRITKQIDNDNEWGGLEWWGKHEKKFPNMSVMARQYLGVPATSATVGAGVQMKQPSEV